MTLPDSKASAGDSPRIIGIFPGSPDSLAAAYAERRPEVADLFPTPNPSPLRSGTQPARLPSEAIGTPSPAARAKLEDILAGQGRLVSTGQQPLLFGGPLYVVYKALTAIEAARRIEANTGEYCMALFWIAGDDHDWAEVASTRLIDTAGAVQDFSLGATDGRAGTSVGPSALPPGFDETLDGFLGCLPESEFRSAAADILRDSYRPGRSYSEAFADVLCGLLPADGWAWLDSANPIVRHEAAPLLRWALESRSETEDAFRSGTARVEALGFAPQMTYLPDSTQLFWDVGGRRTRLYAGTDADTLRLGRRGEAIGEAAVLAALEKEPRAFSPPASMRPVVESWLLPIAATVLGPSEIAYWAQLGPLFDAAGVQMPAVVGRFGWRIEEHRISKILDRLGVPAEALARPDVLTKELVHDSVPPNTGRSLEELRSALEERFEHLASAIDSELPGLKASSGKAYKAVFDALADLERAIESRTRDQQTTLMNQVRKAAIALYPDGSDQERVVNSFYFVARHGTGLVGQLSQLGSERELAISADVAGSVGPG